MSQDRQIVNNHVKEYLDYYCDLSHAPGYAVLLKGQWGVGKTWFIEKYREKPKGQKEVQSPEQKFLYISLYGITTFSEIEDQFFQQLHPILSSKGMAIAGKIFKGALKTTLKIDLNSDGKEDGSISSQIPDINFPDYLKNTDQHILIFDDLERCQMDIGSLLGYINYFVEHQDLKVIIIANEDELLKHDDNRATNNYKKIKEKLIGQTFEIAADLNKALDDFITCVDNKTANEFLSRNTGIIRELYELSEYNNLRNIKQVFWDFERIFRALPSKAQKHEKLLQDILTYLLTFSIEIRRGELQPKDISRLIDAYTLFLLPGTMRLDTGKEEELKEKSQEILKRYKTLRLVSPTPGLIWWQTFFEKGIIDKENLDLELENSIYFQDENTPKWKKLYHYTDLSDDEFDDLLKENELDYASRKYTDIGVIKHLTGLFLKFSDIGIYKKSKEGIIQEAKQYIDDLCSRQKIDLSDPKNLTYSAIEERIAYERIGFAGKDFNEFQEFCDYIVNVQNRVRLDNMPKAAQDLLKLMKIDTLKFGSMIFLSKSEDQIYYETPILNYINPNDFIQIYISLNGSDKGSVEYALRERYKFSDINPKLFKELNWLETISEILVKEVAQRQSKLSGYMLDYIRKNVIEEAINKLRSQQENIG
jgi:KAP family P-loop domain